MGPMTGRRAGYCNGNPGPGASTPTPGDGFRRGFRPGRGGWGREGGWRHGFHATSVPGWAWDDGWERLDASPPSAEDERRFLAERVRALEEELELARKRLQVLDRDTK
jgi:hypothetical protein